MSSSITNPHAQIGLQNVESLILASRPLAQPCDEDIRNGHSLTTQLAGIVQQRTDLDRQLSEERNILAKRCAYLRDCRLAGDKEKLLAQKELATAMLLLAAAETEQAFLADCRATASEEQKLVTLVQRQCQTQKICCHTLGLETMALLEQTHGHSSLSTWFQSLQLHLNIAPILPSSLPGFPVIATLKPPHSLREMQSSGPSADSFSNPEATAGGSEICSMPEPVRHLEALIDLKGDDGYNIGVTSEAGVKVEVPTVSGILENPIGPYIRPPMPLEDMLKCIRCLFGKDKSLKTGNRARAFLGVPWSEIVSYDPDVLLRRGVLGIKEGSTGMASRLRMMTIIESALSNQNDVVSAVVLGIATLAYILPLMPIDNSCRGLGEAHSFLRQLSETLSNFGQLKPYCAAV